MCVHLSVFPWILPTKTKPSSRRTSCAATCILLPKIPMSGGQHPKAKADSSLRLAALQQPVTWEPHVAPSGHWACGAADKTRMYHNEHVAVASSSRSNVFHTL